MANRIRIYLDNDGVADILRYNPQLESMERNEMESRLSQIQAAFLQNFGFQGRFEIQAVQTRPGRTHGRLSYRIRAADAKTNVALARNPGWIGQFI